MDNSNNSSHRLQRNMKERNRRMQMKYLIDNLAPLVHPQPSTLTVLEVVNHAINHVTEMRKSIEKLKRIKGSEKIQDHYKNSSSSSRKPVLDIRISRDSILEVNLVTGLENKNFMSYELITVLQEGGANVISFTCHNAGDRVIYAIRSQVISPRIGMEVSTIHERLKELVY